MSEETIVELEIIIPASSFNCCSIFILEVSLLKLVKVVYIGKLKRC